MILGGFLAGPAVAGEENPGAARVEPSRQEPETSVATPLMIAAIDGVRRWGVTSAPRLAELIVDLNCPHCADIFTPTLFALKPYAERGQIELLVRWWVRPRDLASRDLIMHVLAATDRTQCGLLSSLVVGTPAGRDWMAMRGRLAELVDPEAVERRFAVLKPAIEAVLNEDRQRIQSRAVQHVPCLIISNRDGRETNRWSDKGYDLDSILATLKAEPLPAVPEVAP